MDFGAQFHKCIATSALALASFTLLSCGGGGGGASSGEASTLAIAPSDASAFLGAQLTFSVSGASGDAAWSVNGIAGGNAAVGMIASTGASSATYTAPRILPDNPGLTITATAAGAQANASVTIRSNVAITLAPSTVQMAPGSTQTFTAGISGSGNPAPGVTWSVNGIAGGNDIFGTITPTGEDSAQYTAPVVPPSSDVVEIVAISIADPSRSASSKTTIACTQPNSISPPSVTLQVGSIQTFTAGLCIASGSPIQWSANGIIGGNSANGTITATGDGTAEYVAPSSVPAGNPVTITAASVVSPAQFASALATIVSNVQLSISPNMTSVALGQRATFTAMVVNSGQTPVWSVGGVLNGSPALGLICVVGSNPCQSPPDSGAGEVDYLAPAIYPVAATVISATINVDPPVTATASVTLLSSPASGLSIVPFYAFIAPQGLSGDTQQFTASLDGTNTSAVSWSLVTASGGQCTAATCGIIDANGFYTAPPLTPSPNLIFVVATSTSPGGFSATASIALTSGPVIQTLLPSSVFAGIPGGFQLTLGGQNFIAGVGEGASSVLINGVVRGTTCPDSTECAVILTASDLAQPGTLIVQVQNPGNPGALSNPVPFVVIPSSTQTNAISLTAGVPFLAQQDIAAVNPTTAGTGPDALTINFAGPLTNEQGSIDCTLQQSAITVIRPRTGSIVSSLCVQGSGLDSTMAYKFTGPSDIQIVVTPINGFLNNLMELDLTISSSTQPGLRSLLVTTGQQDAVVASGLLEVE